MKKALILLVPSLLVGCAQQADVGHLNKTPAAPARASAAPESVKSAGFRYYGLGHSAAIAMKSVINGQTQEGTVQTSLLSASGSDATYHQAWSGSLSTLGDSELRADPKGIYVTAVYGHKLAEPQLDLPAKPDPGVTWDFHTQFKGPGGEDFAESGSDKVIGVQKIKVGKSTFDALLVSETGTITQGTQTAEVQTKKWMVKDLGAVKMELTTKPKKGPPTVITVEAEL